jgi:hypothetical protein
MTTPHRIHSEFQILNAPIRKILLARPGICLAGKIGWGEQGGESRFVYPIEDSPGTALFTPCPVLSNGFRGVRDKVEIVEAFIQGLESTEYNIGPQSYGRAIIVDIC